MKKFVVVFLMMLMMVCFTIGASAVTVPDGHVGIKIVWGTAQNDVLRPGFYFDLIPWHSYEIVDCRWQKYNVKTSAFSKDIQQVDIQASLNFSLSSEGALDMYKSVGMDYQDKIMMPIFLDVLKSTFAKYSAEELVSRRESISAEVQVAMAEALEFYKLYVREIAIEDIDFTDAFTNAIEAKQVATQKKLQVQTEQEQLTMERKSQAERDLIAAQAALDVAKIEAEAVEYAGQKEAAANAAIAKSITPELIEYYKAQKWNGQLPTFNGGGSTTMMFDASTLMSPESEK